MKWNSIIFIIGFIIAFAGGYFFFTAGSSPDPEEEATPTEETSTPDEAETEDAEEEGEVTVPDDALSLSRNGCLSCHSVDSLGIAAGNIGPDLTIAYSGVEGKHGKELDAFLQEPTSAVMATVLADNPLDDDEREQIVEVLKKASEEAPDKEQLDEEEPEESDED